MRDNVALDFEEKSLLKGWNRLSTNHQNGSGNSDILGLKIHGIQKV